MTVFPPCATCARFNRKDKTQEVCEAYPNGIPQEILDAETDHREVYPGDGGLVWKPVAGWTEGF